MIFVPWVLLMNLKVNTLIRIGKLQYTYFDIIIFFKTMTQDNPITSCLESWLIFQLFTTKIYFRNTISIPSTKVSEATMESIAPTKC